MGSLIVVVVVLGGVEDIGQARDSAVVLPNFHGDEGKGLPAGRRELRGVAVEDGVELVGAPFHSIDGDGMCVALFGEEVVVVLGGFTVAASPEAQVAEHDAHGEVEAL